MSKKRWSKVDSIGRAAHAKLMTDARWKGKTEAERKAHGQKLLAGRIKAAEIRKNSAI